MVWLAGKLQRDLATAANYVEDQRRKISRDGFSAWRGANYYKIVLRC